MSETQEIISAELVLTPLQETAMLMLLSGSTQRDAAAVAGVSEFTVSRWVNTDAMFRQLYAKRRADVRAAHEAKINQIAGHALSMLDRLIGLGDDHIRIDGIKIALKMAGLLPTGTRVASFGGQINIGEQQVNMQKGNENNDA